MYLSFGIAVLMIVAVLLDLLITLIIKLLLSTESVTVAYIYRNISIKYWTSYINQRTI